MLAVALLANSAAHSASSVPEVHEAIQRGWDRVESAFARQIRRAQRDGQLDDTLDPIASGRWLGMALLGSLTLARAGRTDLEPGIDQMLDLLAAASGEPTGRS